MFCSGRGAFLSLSVPRFSNYLSPHFVVRSSCSCSSRSSSSLTPASVSPSLLASTLFVSIFLLSSIHSSHSCSTMSASSSETCAAPPAVSVSSSSPSGGKRMPTVYLGHGGGPCFFMDASDSPMFEGIDRDSKATKWIKGTPKELGFFDGGKYGKPKALLLFSAHWESNLRENGKPVILVTSQEKHPELYYDYGGFPSYTYELDWPAPGNPKLAAKIVSLLQSAGISAQEDRKRNFDHGTFVPMKLWFPDADIPTVQVSLHSSLDPVFHEKLGAALSTLRDEGVLIIGSGMAGHGFRLTRQQAKEFIDELTRIIEDKQLSAEQRLSALTAWKKFPNAKLAHPREEHLIPIYAVLGAANGARGRLTLKDAFFGMINMPLHTYIFDE